MSDIQPVTALQPVTRTCPFDPPPEYRTFREEAPVAQVTFPDGAAGWLVTRYADIRTVLADPRFSSRRRMLRAGIPLAEDGAVPPPAPGWFILMDAPEHTRFRRLLTGQFTVRRMRELMPAVERAERAERTREEEARRRVTEERLRIARELHDVVAHHITLVNAQAGVAHHLMGSDPGHAGQALERIRDTGRAALDELRATVGVLRNGETADAPREPAPALGDIGHLLDSFRHSGLDIALERTGRAVELAAITDLAAYRSGQEALTNTRKHAGPVPARVRLEYRTDVLRVTVEDDGPAGTGGGGPAPTPDTG